MSSLTMSPRRMSREDVLLGTGLSLVVHVLIFAVMITSPFWGKSSRPMQVPYSTVKLVSMEELGSGPLPAPKGTVANSSEVAKGQESHKSSGGGKARSAPVVPVKRLQVEEPAAKPVTELKKYEAPEAPKVTDTAASSAATVDKSLEKLITKPKPAPKPAPIVQQGPKEEPLRQASQETAARNTASSSAAAASAKAVKNAPQSEPAAGGGATDAQGKGKSAGQPQGQDTGTAKGTTEGQGDGKGGWGSPEGSRVATALLSMYGHKVKDAINRQWMVPESVKPQGLEARLVVVVSRDGKVLDLKVEKGSGNPLFDESALRAVRKASPLPALPEVYSSPTLEFDIRFRPEGLS